MRYTAEATVTVSVTFKDNGLESLKDQAFENIVDAVGRGIDFHNLEGCEVLSVIPSFMLDKIGDEA